MCIRTGKEINGGEVTICIKYKDMIPVLNEKFNLCGVVEGKCPLEAGVHDVSLKENVPSYAPSVRKTT